MLNSLNNVRSIQASDLDISIATTSFLKDFYVKLLLRTVHEIVIEL